MARKISPFLFLFILHSAAVWGQEFFNTTPQPIRSNFTCVGRITGYYADIPSNCRVYHNCDDQGNKFSYYCPEMTAFRQEALICDHAHLVDCQAGTRIGKKSQEQNRKNLDQSTPGRTRTADRWTTANPFRDFLLDTNLTIRDGLQKTRTTSVPLKVLPSNPFSARFGTKSGSIPDFRSNHRSENLRNDDGLQSTTFTDQNRTQVFGNNVERLIKSKEILLRTRTSDDQTTVNSQSRFNHGNNFRGHSEVGDRQVESTTSRFNVFGQTQTTKSYLQSKSSNYPWPDRTQGKSSKIPVLTSTKTPSTTFSTSTEIPLRDITASLKPLVPNTLEYDPYYPGESWTTTESYYTPVEGSKLPQALEAPNFEPSKFGVYFKIPDVWPDLNTLEDFLDRRRLFYIPRSEKIR